MDTQPRQNAPIRCALIFSTASIHPQKPAPQLRNETNIPYLNSYANAANETTQGCPKRRPSYGHASPSDAQTAPNRPQNTLPQLRHETKIPYLNSYANAANETTSSYEQSVSSYDSGRTPSCDHSQTRLQTALPQLRHETTNPKLNSYGHETKKTTVTAKVCPSWARPGSRQGHSIIACSATLSFPFVLSEVV